MSEFVNSISQIGCSCDRRDICDAPESLKERESLRSLYRRNISIGATGALLQFAHFKEDPGGRSRTCEGVG